MVPHVCCIGIALARDDVLLTAHGTAMLPQSSLRSDSRPAISDVLRTALSGSLSLAPRLKTPLAFSSRLGLVEGAKASASTLACVHLLGSLG
ncbi:hypothetical protein [Bifidobacterium goeldii]|uniref:hypothetical protein n=1 Tax=Bifidobacterium goeldii TaxID=2306975 RepID=UPI000F7F99DC|nr:hypothetical protein [Bifidobacterium goeldii]